VVFGLDNALIPIVAYNLGAKKGNWIKKGILLASAYSVIIGLVGTAILKFGVTPIMQVFPNHFISWQNLFSGLRFNYLLYHYKRKCVLLQ
jgi:Na+-driven multidrug efflux pump